MAEINTKLISVEGIPGTGKSMAAQFITDILTESGANISFFDDNDMSHPAEYTFHAFMKDAQISALTAGEQQQLYAEGTKRVSGLIIPLTKISVSLFGKVIPYKIYDNLDWETEKPIMQEQWQYFAKKAAVSSKTYIFKNCVLQNPINEMMMRFDFAYSKIWDYIFNIYRAIAALNTVIIYIKCNDIRSRIEEEARSRNSRWLNGLIDYHTTQGYGKRNGLTGIEGCVDCLEARQRIELKILNELPIEKLILTDPFNDWTDANNKIAAYLKKKSPAAIL